MRSLYDIDGVHPRDLTYRQRLLLAYLGSLVSIIFLFTILYHWGMGNLEGRPQSIFQSLQTVVETMTTTGYGADAPWETPVMNVLMIFIQMSGIVIGLVTLRILIIPLFERTPLNLDDRLTPKDDHVVVAEYRRDTDVLLDELEELDVSYVLVDSNDQEAKRLSDDGYQVINGDPEEGDVLRRASIERASVLITDAGDSTASIVLTAREINDELRVISFTESTRRKAALREVGVDRSVAPHALIGQRLAEKATSPVTIEDDSKTDTIEVREVLVRRGSSLEGIQVGDSPVAHHPSVTLIAGWFDGELHVPPSPKERLTLNTVLVVAGPADVIDELTDEIAGVQSRQIVDHSRIIVAGYSEGGHAAVDALPADTAVTTVDESVDAGADIVGDVTEPETLQQADITTASALIVTVDDDSTALLTIAMARSLSSGIEILARVTDGEKVKAAFRAGADFVLSTQRVSARLVAGEVHGERVMDPTGQIRLVRVVASPFVGESLADARANTERGWTIVGVSRDGVVQTAEHTTIETNDEVFIAGSDDAIQDYERLHAGE